MMLRNTRRLKLRRRQALGACQLHQKHHWCVSLRSACRRRQRRLPREYGVWRLIGFGSADSAPSDSACGYSIKRGRLSRGQVFFYRRAEPMFRRLQGCDLNLLFAGRARG